jgi:HK97 family phage major capsid protein
MKKHISILNIFARLYRFHARFFVLGLTDEEFQSTVLKGVKDTGDQVKALDEKVTAQKSQLDEVVQNYDQWSADNKKAMEDLTLAKNTLNDQAVILAKLQKAMAAARNEQRMAFGDPLRRLLANDEHKARLNAAFRSALDLSGDLGGQIKAITKALGEDSSPGSTLINDALLMEIYDSLQSYGVWNTFAVRNLGTKITKMPIKTARPVAGYVLTEGGTISDDTNKAGASVSLEVEAIAVLLNVSLQLLQDAEFDVAADVLADFMEAFAYRLDWSCLQADGTADATDGGMTGVFAGGTAVTAASGNTSVETTDFEDWTKVILGVDAGVLSRPCRWWMHPHILVRALSVKDSNGRPIFLTATEAPTPGGIGSLLGYPVTPAHAAPNTNAASAKIAVFGDPNAYVVGLRRDFEFAASDQHKWDTLQRSFRGVGRAGTKMRKASALAVMTLPAE